ncbi:MAG: hypothetical protein CM1200mP27_04660 [Chloroflexota bacterium]|nr:MAG: hypothetical protein CM1200mP27_04660 [Chloroflexota bacterium]
MISRYKSFTRDFETALFGNILGVTIGDFMAIVVVTLAAILVLFVAYKYFLFATFDGEVAQFYGVPVGWVETLFSLVLAATIVGIDAGIGSTVYRGGYGHTSCFGQDVK